MYNVLFHYFIYPSYSYYQYDVRYSALYVYYFHYCIVFQETIESSINVHVNDGRIYISLVTDGTLKSIYQRRALHYSSMTIVMSVIVHLFFTRYLSFSPRSTVSTQRYLVILIHKR